MFWIILRHLSKADVVHTRAPSSPAFLAMLLCFFFRKKIWWHKYAGNWAQEKPPFFYGLQRRLLQTARHARVTINGAWPGQPAHCLSFENPCLSETEWHDGAGHIGPKAASDNKIWCFAGRLEKAKGLGVLLDAMQKANPGHLPARLLVAGDGPDKSYFQAMAARLPLPVAFVGNVSREDLFGIYRQSHFIFLPSQASEGFPKVLAEAAAHGCIPVASDLSSIGQYIRHGENGWLIRDDLPSLLAQLRYTETMARQAHAMARPFTYERYLERIRKEILALS